MLDWSGALSLWGIANPTPTPQDWIVHRTLRLPIAIVLVAWWATVATGQTVTVMHNVNLRPDPSSEYAQIRLLLPSEPPLTLLEPNPESGYYHVQTSSGEEAYVWSRYVRVTVPATPPAGPGVPGSASMVGCGDGWWQHVYHPSRLLVKQDCVTITGVIVDATAGQAHHHADGMRTSRTATRTVGCRSMRSSRT